MKSPTRSLSFRLQTVGAAIILAALFSAEPGRAASDEQATQCLDAYESGQRSRKVGALREAKASFALCSSEACPRALHVDCSRWLDEVEQAIPTGVFHVTGEGGRELDSVEVAIDGGSKQELDGRAITFDPGEHTVVFSRSGYESHEQRFTFSEGDKLARHDVSLVPSAPASTRPTPVAEPKATPQRASLLPAWVGASVGVVGAAGFAWLGSTARRDDNALDGCSPRCSTARVDDVKREYLLANVSLGVGAAGFLAAGAWLLFRPNESPAKDTGRASPRVEVRIGAVTSLTCRF
ncbi:MAG TPA: hypothetical protein VFQ61_06890 [Polyangiaceae bacterium]|nr:hypothetical protein [Polyangiaceae bacterium]